MKKYNFLVFHKDYDNFLNGIQELGVLHVIEKQSGSIEDDSLRDMYQQLNELKNSIKFLEKKLPDKTLPKPKTNIAPEEILHQLHDLLSEKDQHEQRLSQLSKEIAQLTPWGEFSWENINRLRDSGLQVSFYSCPSKKVNPEWADKFYYEIIGESSGQVFLIIVTKQGENTGIDLEELKLPEKTLSSLIQERNSLEDSLKNINKQFGEFSIENLSTLKSEQARLKSNFDYKKVKLNTSSEANNKLLLLEGWVPVDAEEKLNQYIGTQGVFALIDDPLPEDNVPVKLKNNRFTQLFEVVGEMYSLPNYHELDLTPLFAPFFMLFFGFCLGDAGYGLLLVVAATLLKMKKETKKMHPIFSLVQWLGLSTIVMGIISGTFFGIPLLEVEGLSIRKFMLNSNQLFNLSLGIGLVQIIFGMGVKAYSLLRFKGLKYALSTLGWILLMLGMIAVFGLDKFKLLPEGLKSILIYSILGVSGFLIFIFCDPDSNPLISSLKGIWDVYGMVSGVFGDTLSYIRLFALGTSGAILGFVINTIAMQILSISFIGPVFFVIFLILGHALTIGLSILGAFVHPMRLTFVEFYKNAGFEGGGKPYKPFKIGTSM